MESKRMQTARAYLEAHSQLSYPALVPFIDKSITYQVLPTSLEVPIRDISELKWDAEKKFVSLTRLAMVTKKVFEDADRNAVVVFCDVEGDLIGFGPWNLETVITLRFSEDGERVVEEIEFVDSLKARELKSGQQGSSAP